MSESDLNVFIENEVTKAKDEFELFKIIIEVEKELGINRSDDLVTIKQDLLEAIYTRNIIAYEFHYYTFKLKLFDVINTEISDNENENDYIIRCDSVKEEYDDLIEQNDLFNKTNFWKIKII